MGVKAGVRTETYHTRQMEDELHISQEAIEQFQTVTNGSRKQAIRYLTRYDNNVNAAVIAFCDSKE